MDLALRRAATADLEMIEAFRRELYTHDPEAIDVSRDRETLLHLINKPDLGWAMIAVADGESVGYVLVTFCFSVEFGGRFALIDELYVIEERRGTGVGGAVLTQLDQFLSSAPEISAVRLEVERMNLGAWRLYRRHGFEAHDRRIMTKWLRREEDDADGQTITDS
jgi:ribosomal protein S18 acetylase RimI-like enzyme